MEKTSRLQSMRLESQSSGQIAAYFQRAGSFGHIALMVLFYTSLLLMYWVAWS
jgi:hypothetical protein